MSSWNVATTAFGLLGVAGGVIAALYYRVKYADLRSEAVGLRKDNEALQLSVNRTENEATEISKRLDIERAEKLDMLRRRDEVIDSYKAKQAELTTLLAKYAKDHPEVAAERLGGLFKAKETK